MTGDKVLFKDWYLIGRERGGGGAGVKPRPQNKILVPLRGSFQNYRRAMRTLKD